MPSNPDRCFVCQETIHGDYKAHVRSEEHRRNVEENRLYQEIDVLIAELSLDSEIREL